MILLGLRVDQNVLQVYFTKLINYTSKCKFIYLKDIVGALHNPKGIIIYSYKPSLVIKADF